MTDPLRPVTSEAELRAMVRESAGLHGSGVLSFRIVGGGYGHELFLAAHRGDRLAGSLMDACLGYIAGVEAAPPGSVSCLTCGGPFTVPAEPPWGVLLVYADIPEPTLAQLSGLCTHCCTWKSLALLQYEITAAYQVVFPGWGVLAISPEVGHA